MNILPDEILTIIIDYSISEYSDYINLSQISSTWYNICAYILHKFSNIRWNDISYNQKLSEKFIKQNEHQVYWIYISINQKLSEEFIKQNEHQVDWVYISCNQKLSEAFIKQNENK